MNEEHLTNMSALWKVPTMTDIIASNNDEYERKRKELPNIFREFSILKNKRKVEPAGFTFYVKYEIETVLKNKKKNNNDNLQIEEIFLYKDKIDLLNEMERKDNGTTNENNKRNKKDDANDKYSGNFNDREYDKEGKKKEKTFKKGTSLVKKYIADKIDIYDILNVEECDGIEKIKTNYKKLILIFHPDKSKGTAILHVEKKKNKGQLPQSAKNTKKGDNSGANNRNNNTNNNEVNRNEKNNDENDLIHYMKKYKVGRLSEEEKKAMFLKIQDAYTILSDADLRKQYDSSVTFDETIPTAKDLEASGNFYDFLRPVFKRNAKWSVIKPVPDIGDENTDIKTVRQFYDFWYSFTSWRDFSCQNEYDYEQAECREERRWMEKENKKIQKKASRLENLRILKLVDLAYQRDPRLIAEKQRIQLEKQKKKEQQALLEKQKKMELAKQTSLKKRQLNGTNKDTNNASNGTNKLDSSISGNDVNKNLSPKEKMALKIWKHHIKSVCYIKLTNIIKTEALVEKLPTIPFDVMCDFIYDIYIILNFDVTLFDEITMKKRNDTLSEMNEKEMKLNQFNVNNNDGTNSSCASKQNGNLQGNHHTSENNKKSETTNTPNLTNGNLTNTKAGNAKKGLVKSNSKNATYKKHTNNYRNKNSSQKQADYLSKSAGFLDLIKNKQLEKEEVDALVNVFKKYITGVDIVNENYVKLLKENANTSNIQTEVTKRECFELNKETKPMSENKGEETCSSTTGLKTNQSNPNTQEVEACVQQPKGRENSRMDEKQQSEKSQEETNENNLKWSTSEMSLLAKALKAYPGGTKDRWRHIANYVKTKSEKEIIKKTKEMFENDTLKNLGNKFEETPFDHFKQANKGVMKKINDDLDKRECNLNADTKNSLTNTQQETSSNSAAANNNNNNKSTVHPNEKCSKGKPWTEEEQALLEKALVKYPSSIEIKKRLKLIAAEIPTRCDEEIVARLKQIRAKILAQKNEKQNKEK